MVTDVLNTARVRSLAPVVPASPRSPCSVARVSVPAGGAEWDSESSLGISSDSEVLVAECPRDGVLRRSVPAGGAEWDSDSSLGTCSDSEVLVEVPRPLSGRPWEVWWDGSHQECGSGIGITVGTPGQPPLAGFSVPVVAADATRVEALGPPLAATLLAVLEEGVVTFHGDSHFVCDLLTRKVAPRDSFLFNCVALTRDLLV